MTPTEEVAKAPTKPNTTLEIRAPPLPHITMGFVPLSLLINRLVQNSHNKLVELIDSLQSSGQSDGEKKLRIIDHMQETRKQFIKVLVLVTWAKNASAVSEVIDLKAYLDSRQDVFHKVVWNLYEVRRKMSYARVPNPDLDTAVQVLSTGVATTSMTRRYVPPPPLSSTEILKTLSNINTLLALRFSLHSPPPPYFKDYTISSGRATFKVEHEFEVDMSVGDEDPTSQLYLIDFRLAFKPAAGAPFPETLKNEIEGRGNTVLKSKGLEGIHDFLHDFCLTHKINILMRQAHEMLQGRWTENLRIQQIKRTLVIQYWTNRAGEGKSWIEVGVKRGVAGKPSRLGVRWMREGKEVKDVEVPLNVAVLSAEELLKTVIALHTKWILTGIRDYFSPLPLFPPSSMQLNTHPTDSFNSFLKLRLTPSRAIKVLIEPITGRFALQKPGLLASSVEGRINQQPGQITELLKLKFLVLQEEIESRARSMGWEILKMVSVRKEEFKTFFPPTTRYMTFMRRQGWSKEWVITIGLGNTGECFYVSRIHEAPQQWTVSLNIPIPVNGALDVTYGFLANLEKISASIITLHTITEDLTSRSVQHQLKPSKTADTKLIIPDLYIRFSSLIPRANWGIDALRVTFQSLSDSGACTLTVCGRTAEAMTHLGVVGKDIASADSDVSFHPQTGSYAIRFIVPVGESIIDPLIEKLSRIETLIKFVAVIRRFQLPCLHVSLGRIGFKYSNDAHSTAEVSFGADDNNDTKMRLHLPPRSPHARIKHFLENSLNTSGLEIVVMALTVTLPLLLAFTDLESTPPNQRDDALFILPRNVDWFRVEYKLAGVVLDWRLKCRKSVLYWYVQDAAVAGAESERGVRGGEGRRKAEMLKPLWCGEIEGDWEALKIGAAAGVRVVGALVKAVDALVRKPIPGQQQQPLQV